MRHDSPYSPIPTQCTTTPGNSQHNRQVHLRSSRRRLRYRWRRGAQVPCPAKNPEAEYSQVIIAFVAAAGLAVISAAFCLLFSRCAHGDTSHPDYDQYREAASASREKDPNVDVLDEPPKPFNAIDRFARYWACRNAQSFVRDHCNGDPAILGRCFYDVVITLGDQQTVMGIAVMAAALIRMHDGEKPLSTYHFVIISDLVWFSSNAHLLALLVIRSYDDSAKPGSLERKDKARRKKSAKAVRAVRALLMSLLAVLLVWSSVLTGDETLYDRFRCPAVCLSTSGDGKGGEPKKWMILNIFYIAYNYPVALFMLSRTLRQWWMEKVSRHMHEIGFLDDLRARLVRGLLSVSEKTPTGEELSASTALRETAWRAGPVRFLVKRIPYCVWTFLSSELLDFVEVGVWFSLGVSWMRGDRDYGHYGQGMMDQTQRHIEDAWGFGQLVPLFLLILPFMQFFESYAAYCFEEELRDRKKS